MIQALIAVLSALVLSSCSPRVDQQPPAGRVDDDFVMTENFDFDGLDIPLYTNWIASECPANPSTRFYVRKLDEPGLGSDPPHGVPAGAVAVVHVHKDAYRTLIGAGCDREGPAPTIVSTGEEAYGSMLFVGTEYTASGYADTWFSPDLNLAIDLSCTTDKELCDHALQEVRTGLTKIGRAAYCWEAPAQLRTDIELEVVPRGSETEAMRLVRPPYAAVIVAARFSDGSVGSWIRTMDGNIYEIPAANGRVSKHKPYPPKKIDADLRGQVERAVGCLNPDAHPVRTYGSEEDI